MERVEAAVVIDIPEPVVSSAWQEELEALSDESMDAENFTIFRVPAQIRQRNKHLYEPQTVAIGPYSRSDEPSLRTMEWLKPSHRAMEWLKLRYFRSFRSRSGNRPIDEYIAEIQKLVPQARQCYFERVELCTEKFAKMLLLDGCFIIEFLIKWNEENDEDILAAEWSLPLISDDLLMLENQIPLFVLKKLFEFVMSNRDGTAATPIQSSEGEIPSLMELLVNYIKGMIPESLNEKEEVEDNNNCANENNRANEAEVEDNNDRANQAEVEGNNNPANNEKEFHHLLHLYYDCCVTKQQTHPMDRRGKKSAKTIPSATELLEAGVTIKRKNQNTNQNCLSSFLDITFSLRDGVLEIPSLSVDPSTLPRFSNLVAFEQCGGCESPKAFMTSYAWFMNCLIDTPKDVAILHQKRILENNLASDKELALFFNQLSDWATLDFENHYLAGLFRDVREYCDSSWHKWRAILVRNHFSNPWAIISLIAAAVVLILTIVQTVYTIYPYYYPRNPLLSSWELAVSDVA